MPMWQREEVQEVLLAGFFGRGSCSYADLRMTEGLLAPRILRFAGTCFGKEVVQQVSLDFHFHREDLVGEEADNQVFIPLFLYDWVRGAEPTVGDTDRPENPSIAGAFLASRDASLSNTKRAFIPAQVNYCPRNPGNSRLADYLRTYVERDLRDVLRVLDLDAFERFVRLAAARTGQELNLTALAADAGISQPTAQAWITALSVGFIVTLLPPHHANFRKRPRLH